MQERRISRSLFGTFLAAGVAPGQTLAGTPPPSTTRQPPTTSPPATAGSTARAFDKLSPGHQLIARALFEAQKTGAPSRTTASQPGTASRPVPLTLDRIAALKGSGLSWGQVFKHMKAQGQIEAKNLGQVASHFAREQRALSGSSKPTSTGEVPRSQV